MCENEGVDRLMMMNKSQKKKITIQVHVIAYGT